MKVGDLVEIRVGGSTYTHIVTKIQKRRNHYGTHDDYAQIYGLTNWWPEHNVKVLSA